jgi:histidinol-phosphate/aromatic aminotransferase/cobyric acid decarboxylase-like protein
MLATSSYDTVAALQDQDGCLNLAWTLDEQDFLPPVLHQQVRAALCAGFADDGRYVDRYLVKDPYGEAMLGAAVARHFGIAADRCAVSCAAGVNALLHGLAHWAQAGPAYLIGDVYPDFPHWVSSFGGRCVSGEPVGADGHAAHILRAGAAVVLIERPALHGDSASADIIAALCRALADTGVVVVVDESNANYCPARFSAATRLAEADNLVVLRGLSKAYHLGGLRLGYAICNPALASRVRAVLAPLQTASLSLQLGRAILAQGDHCAALRERIGEARTRMAQLLARSGCPGHWRSADGAPYFFFGADGLARRWMEARAVMGKMQPFWIAARGAIEYDYRLSIPLSEARMALFALRIGGSLR